MKLAMKSEVGFLKAFRKGQSWATSLSLPMIFCMTPRGTWAEASISWMPWMASAVLSIG